MSERLRGRSDGDARAPRGGWDRVLGFSPSSVEFIPRRMRNPLQRWLSRIVLRTGRSHTILNGRLSDGTICILLGGKSSEGRSRHGPNPPGCIYCGASFPGGPDSLEPLKLRWIAPLPADYVLPAKIIASGIAFVALCCPGCREHHSPGAAKEAVEIVP